ncbi:MAG: hypothetical protein QXY20_07095 [Thermofilum sp.]|uniref:hypothetical protein n=1 Tax=Thermofilum sp. TaxID=1961369 RepID=UPI0031613497
MTELPGYCKRLIEGFEFGGCGEDYCNGDVSMRLLRSDGSLQFIAKPLNLL